jgi:hypothetical protein
VLPNVPDVQLLNQNSHDTAVKDNDFIDYLSTHGWTVTDRARMIQTGQTVCNVMASPPYPKAYQVAEAVSAQWPDVSPDGADTLVADAIADYCPQYLGR